MDGHQGVEAKSSPISGKGLFTKRAFNAGEAVLQLERPLVGVLDKGRAGDTCAWCFTWTSLPLYREADPNGADQVNACSGCRKVAYCSKKCQSRHWKSAHKRECKSLAALPDVYPRIPVAMAQIVRGMDAGDQACKAVLEMESHKGDYFQESGEKNESMEAMARATLMLLGEGDNRLPLMLLLTCIFMSNSSNLVAPTFDPIGFCLDPFASKANHSCAPNAIMVFDGPRLQLRSLEPLASGQEVLISYIECNNPYGVRQAELKERFHFDCKCSKCRLGRNAPQDAFLPISEGLDMGEFPQSLVSKTNEGFVHREHQLGDTQELKSLASLQAFAFQCLDPNHHLGQEMMSTRAGIDMCLQTGAWPITRAPLPALYQSQIPESLSEGKVDAAFLAALKTYCLVDPVIYPQPFHPVRIVHAWTLSELGASVHEASGSQSAIKMYALARGIRLTTIRLRVLLELADQAPKSHGTDSVFGRITGMAWQGILAEASHPGDDMMKLMRKEAEYSWPKIRNLAEDPALERLINGD